MVLAIIVVLALVSAAQVGRDLSRRRGAARARVLVVAVPLRRGGCEVTFVAPGLLEGNREDATNDGQLLLGGPERKRLAHNDGLLHRPDRNRVAVACGFHQVNEFGRALVRVLHPAIVGARIGHCKRLEAATAAEERRS